MPAGSYCKRMPWGQQKPPLGYQIDRSHSLANGLKRSFQLNELNGGIASDLVDGAKLTLSNTRWASIGGQYLNGATDNKLYFNTLGDYRSKPFTVSMRVYCISMVDCYLFVMQDASTYNSILCNLNRYGVLAIVVEATVSKVHESASTVTTGKWYHLTFTDNGVLTDYTGARMYIDGKEVEYAVAENGSGFRYGSNGYWNVCSRIVDPSRSLNGYVDNFNFYNRVLSPFEVAQLYAEPYCFIEGWNYGRSYSIPSGAYYGSLIGDSALIGNGVLVGGYVQ